MTPARTQHMRTVAEFTGHLKRRLTHSRNDWALRAALDDTPLPGIPPEEPSIAFPLKPPSEAFALAHPDEVHHWVHEWHGHVTEHPELELETRVFHWRSFGRQELPSRVTVRGEANIVRLCGRSLEGKDFLRRRAAFKELLDCVDPRCRYEDVLRCFRTCVTRAPEGFGRSDFRTLSQVVSWLANHDVSGQYVREIPVPGIDSKWVEMLSSSIRALLPVVFPDRVDADNPMPELLDFFGLKAKPSMVTLRFLDDTLMPPWPRHLSMRRDECATAWEVTDIPRTVIIVENEMSFLALPPIPHTIAIWGHGYSAAGIATLPWLQHVSRVIYWGDVDEDGLRILSQVRAVVPTCVSIAMDAQTLRTWSHLVVKSGRQHSPAGGELPPHLTPEEHSAWEQVTTEGLRLEQERLAWPWVLERLSLVCTTL